MAIEMDTPCTFSSLYRVQLSEEFPLAEVRKLIPYLVELGVDGIYFSPYFTAYSHGYDILDPNQLNDRLGTEEEFALLCAELKQNQLAHIIDVVPNHMSIKRGNLWWEDVLRKGRASPFASFFAIDWEPEKKELKNKILLPILQKSYQETLLQQEISLKKRGEEYYFQYKEERLPLSIESYPSDGEIEAINGSFERMHALLEKQHYRIAFYQVVSHEINYRRFFTINDMVALHIEKKEVLESHHRWVFELIKGGVVEALRIDHPDGLYDPANYFKELKKRAPLPLIVEKILARDEELPATWEVEGSVGYDYLHLLNGLFVYQKNEKVMTTLYDAFLQKQTDYEEILYQSKRLFSDYFMVNELARIARMIEKTSDCVYTGVLEALQIIVSSLPVYRTYIAPATGPSESDQKYIKIAFEQARKRTTHLDSSLIDFLERMFLCEEGEKYKEALLSFQQISGAIMAKGLEDTTFYIYNRLLSLNEVGSDPRFFGTTLAEFTAFNQKKQKRWPLGFLASSTHDTKRSEDVRMRINTLSELPKDWSELLHLSEHASTIDRNTLYFIYQTLLGVCPSHPSAQFLEHLWPLVQKSLREAKIHTNWEEPNLSYEEEVHAFLQNFSKNNHFFSFFCELQKKVDRLGALNSLSATVIRAASCGVFEIYQGTEQLQYTLVDPDNRRAVDFSALATQLSMVKERKGDELFAAGEYNLLKTWLIHKLLLLRKQDPSFFLHAEYYPLKVKGEHQENVIAFRRTLNGKEVIVAAARFYSSLGAAIKECWKGTHLIVPDELKDTVFVDFFTQKKIEINTILSLEELFTDLPFVLYNKVQ